MIKQVVLALIIFAALVIAQDQCGNNVSGPNVASPAKRNTVPSPSCQANVSGPNVASPARRLRTNVVCSGNGYCAGESCVCLAGFSGADCETRTPSTSCQADVSGPNVAEPARKVKTGQCNGNGNCQNGQCVCNNGFYGADCEVPVSSTCSQADVSGPNVAEPARGIKTGPCNGNGYCIGNKLCVCNAGFSGANCENRATTCAPSTAAPTTSTAAPTTAAPTTEAPAPSTAAPTTAAPTTAAPTTEAPAPTTAAPSTAAPSTAAPSTAAPTTAAPTTAAPSTEAPAPSTAAPTTAAPSTAAPTTAAPTTGAPSSTEQISGDNNARGADNSAGKIASLGGIIAAIAVALL